MKEYKGYKYEFYYAGYRIYFEDKIVEYSPLAGNNLLNMDDEMRKKKLYDMIRYEIKKHIKKKK